MEPQYHEVSLALLGMAPCVSPTAEGLLNEIQSKITVPIPASIREWYSYDRSIDVMTFDEEEYQYDSNLCLEIVDLTQQKKRFEALKPEEAIWWAIGDWSSNVGFYVRLPANDDPVVNLIETDGKIIDRADEWTNRRFSEYIFSFCWNRRRESLEFGNRGENLYAGPESFNALQEMYSQGLHVCRPDAPTKAENPFTQQQHAGFRFQFFFFDSDSLIQLWSKHHPGRTRTKVCWRISSGCRESYQATATRLQLCGLHVPSTAR